MAEETKLGRATVAAADLFLRYGFARTTMGDIAQAVGMSRPALYLLFQGKEEAFEAAVNLLNRERMDEIETALADKGSLQDRLWTACDLWLVRVVDLQQVTPDARDMDNLAFPVVRAVYDSLQALIARLIIESAPAPLPASADALSRNLVFSVRGLGRTARDMDDMAAMTRLQVDLFCRALGA